VKLYKGKRDLDGGSEGIWLLLGSSPPQP